MYNILNVHLVKNRSISSYLHVVDTNYIHVDRVYKLCIHVHTLCACTHPTSCTCAYTHAWGLYPLPPLFRQSCVCPTLTTILNTALHGLHIL